MDTNPRFEKRWTVLGVLCLVLFIISLDNTVLNMALPSISASLGATASELQWIVDVYTLVVASLLITTGSMGDRYGRKRFLIIGLSLFGIGSLGAALSRSTAVLIGFRALLGMAGAMIMPSTLSILIDVFRDPQERGKAIAIWSSIFSIGAGIGPIIGGALITRFGWSAVFYLNLPVVAAGIAGALWVVPESKDSRAPKPDFLGVTLSIIGLVSLVFGMISAGDLGWLSSTVIFSFLAGFVFLGLFAWWENRSSEPMFPLEFFKNKTFSGANLSLTISSFAMMGSMFSFSQYFQSVHGYSPLVGSLCMLPMTPMSFLSNMYSVRVERKLGTNRTVALGLILTGTGMLLFSMFTRIDSPYWILFLMLIVLASGFGFTMSPSTHAIMDTLPPNRAGIGSAMNDTTRQLGGALGIAVLGTLMNGVYRAGINQLNSIEGISTLVIEQARSSIQAAHLVAAQLSTNLAANLTLTSNQAFVDGMRRSFLVGGLVMFVAALNAWKSLPRHVKDQVQETQNLSAEVKPAEIE